MSELSPLSWGKAEVVLTGRQVSFLPKYDVKPLRVGAFLTRHPPAM